MRHRNKVIGDVAFTPLQELHPKIVAALLHSAKPDIKTRFEAPRIISDAADVSRRQFEYFVRYLGPLRDEPKPLYPLEALGDPTDVGYRGEHTAAVLDLNRTRSISYIPSKALLGQPTVSELLASRVSANVSAAVVDWLSYMGVAEVISTEDRGKIGHELQVRTSGLTKLHDLTNVGVGVSQVLPIVVMALLSP